MFLLASYKGFSGGFVPTIGYIYNILQAVYQMMGWKTFFPLLFKNQSRISSKSSKNLKVHILNIVMKSISKLILAVSSKQHNGELPRVRISEKLCSIC